MTSTDISTRQATRQVARGLLRVYRERRLPVTWLGTGGHPDPADDGWKDSMWWHPAYAIGGTYLAGTLIDHALTAGLVNPLPLGQLTIPPAGVAGAAAAGLGLAVGAAGLVATAGHRFSDWARAYLTLGPVAAGAWLAGVAATSPYNVPALAAAAAGAAAAMLGYRRMRDEQDRRELAFVSRYNIPAAAAPATPAPPVHEEIDPEARAWNAAFDRVGLRGCRHRKRVETPAGFAVLVRFPESGTIGMGHVAGKLDALERSLRMLKDCLDVDVAIDPVTGRELADRCWIHVDVADILAQTLPMPEDHEPTTINEAFRVGTYIDGRPMMLRLREISALIIGVRGRGKTNLYQVIVHALSRCRDVVLWAIDLKGGRAVKPWLAAWIDGRADRPVFDWVATTRAEAALMLHAANALIEHRGRVSTGGSKIEPSEDHPAVLVLCDEVAALVGRHSGPARSTDWRNPTAAQMAKALTLGIQLGRSEAVDFVLFSQRATVTMVGGGDLKSQCEMRVGLGVTNPGDARSVFQNDSVNARKLAKLKHKRTRGAALVENGDDPNHLVGKTWFYGDGMELVARVERAAIAHAMFPADLPEAEQRAVDTALRALTGGECGYGVGPAGATAERWSLARVEHLYVDGLPDAWTDDEPGDGETLGGGSAPATPPAPRGGTTTAARTATVPTQRGHLRVVPDQPADQPGSRDGGRYYTRRRDRDTGEHAQAASDHTPTATAAAAADESVDVADLDAGFARWLDSLPETSEPPQLADDGPEELSRYDLMVEIIREAGAAGTTPTAVYARMRALGRHWSARTDIYPALRKALADGVIVQPAGKYGHYYHRDHAPTRPA